MSVSVQKLNDVIEHYKRHIDKATVINDNEKIMRCVEKLSQLPITVQNLQKTGIGRVINNLRKYDGNIGESAKCLVIQWKNIVKIEETENFYKKVENSDEEHQDVSSTNDNEELQIDPSITSSIASTSFDKNHSSNELEFSEENNDDWSDHESSRHRHHDKSKNKKSKKDKDNNKKRKRSSLIFINDQEGHVKKRIKSEHKYENSKTKKKAEKYKDVTKFHQEHDEKSDENVRKSKKSSHSDKNKEKHKSSTKSSYKDKHHESPSSHKDKDKSDLKKKLKDKVKAKPQPSTSTTCNTSTNSNNKTFEEALLGIEPSTKKQVKTKCRDRSSSFERDLISPLSKSIKMVPFNLDPEELITNYKPLPQLDIKKKKTVDDMDPLAKIMKTKNMRTKVFSGNKTTFYSEVPSLVDCCIQTIKENLVALEYTGGVPFIILEPILKYATPSQLYMLEYHNHYLIEDTGELWKFHSNKEFRSRISEKDETETWRQFYIRCMAERETKLMQLRQNINANQAASTPVRKTQLAYVDTAVKPPRNIAKRQAKLCMPVTTKQDILNKSMMGENSTAQALSANNRSTVMATSSPVALSSTHSAYSSSAAAKKKKAPLMQKALQLIKSTRRR